MSTEFDILREVKIVSSKNSGSFVYESKTNVLNVEEILSHQKLYL